VEIINLLGFPKIPYENHHQSGTKDSKWLYMEILLYACAGYS
jgi:hypothetical protein